MAYDKQLTALPLFPFIQLAACQPGFPEFTGLSAGEKGFFAPAWRKGAPRWHTVFG